ncbi:MAG: NAD(+)/NADH kinase [Lagierella massiliensis]|nr:NAD(+)/NADH kinase [Lagierella massiliensis]
MSEEKIINIMTNNKEKSNIISEDLKHKFEALGYKCSYDFNDNAILNICVGGDGTFLRAVHKTAFSTIPFVGVNTGTLGFFQEISVLEVDKFIKNFQAGDYEIEKLDLLQGEIFSREHKKYNHKSLNEFVIRSEDTSIIHLDVFIDDNHLETFAGDALLVSTPSGSTAYNYSAGGAVLYRALKGYQLTPLAPINSKAYRSLLNPLVIPSTSILTIKRRPEDKSKTLVINDGLNIVCEDFDSIKIKSSDSCINKLQFNNNWYWMNIKDKFI